MKHHSLIYSHRIKAFTCMALSILLAVGLCLPSMPLKQSYASLPGGIEIRYSSGLPLVTQDNSQYSLKGAVFEVYENVECTRPYETMVTDSSGIARLSNMENGRYYICLEQPSPGFTISDKVIPVDVASATAIIKASAMPRTAAPETFLQEMNAETASKSASSGLKLGSTQYIVSYYDSFDENTILSGPIRSWTLKSDTEGNIQLNNDYLIEGSPLYVNENNQGILPAGHYTVSMRKAPTGYLTPTDFRSFDVKVPTTRTTDPIIPMDTLTENLQVVRGDLSFKKVDESGAPLAGIPFLLTHENTNTELEPERHILVTNEHGEFSSNNDYMAHSYYTNANDDAAAALVDGSYTLVESKLSHVAGTWFSQDEQGNKCNPIDSRGALPYGTYTLKELSCSKNKGMNLSNVQFSIFQDNYTVKLNDIVNTKPSISCAAFDNKDNDKMISPDENSVITEMVDYFNLVSDTKYTLKSEAFIVNNASEIEGESIASETMDLVPVNAYGSVSNQIKFDASKIAGKKLLIQTQLIAEDGTVITQSSNEDAQNDILVEPFINAWLQDAEDLDKYVMGSSASALECIDYDGLMPGNRYTANCALYDKATGNALRDAQGKIVNVRTDFIPENSQGHIEVVLPLDCTAIAGHDIVAFLSINDNTDNIISSKRDIENKDQTIKTVKLTSNATDKSDGDKLFDSKSDSVCIVDTVNYANLVPGEQYSIHGVLMDKETGNPLAINDQPITASAQFVPEDISGSIDVEYMFDASAQSSQVLVAFETVEYNGNTIAKHEDLNDVAQTVTSTELDPDNSSTNIDDSDNPLASSTIDDDETPMSNFDAPKMGDIILRLVVPCFVAIGICAVIAGIVVHKRRKELEPIAKKVESSK